MPTAVRVNCVSVNHGVARFLVKHYSGWDFEGFLDEINIWINRLSKGAGPPQWGRPSANLQNALTEQKVGGGRMHSLCLALFEQGCRSYPAFRLWLRLDLRASAVLILRSSDTGWSYIHGSPQYLAANCRSCDFAFCIIMWAKSVYTYTDICTPHAHTHIHHIAHTTQSYCFCLSGEPQYNTLILYKYVTYMT